MMISGILTLSRFGWGEISYTGIIDNGSLFPGIPSSRRSNY